MPSRTSFFNCPVYGGQVKIGSLGGSDTAGTIATPTIAFGSGTGTVNFNQGDTTALTSSITGLGTVQQLGIGTTILFGSNSYTGSTIISAGSIQAASTNALGSSKLNLGGGVSTAMLSLATNLGGVSAFNWASNGIVALTPGSQILTVSGVMSNVASGGGTFDFLNSTLENSNNVLINFGGLSGFTTNSFRVFGVSGYTFSTNNNQVSAYLSTNANVVVSKNITISNTLMVGSFTVAGASTTTVAPTGTLNASEYVLVTGNSTLADNGLIVTPSLTVDQGSTLMGSGNLNATLTNSGIVTMAVMTINGVVDNFGSVSGSGTVNGNFTNEGSGTLSGSQTLNGNVTSSGSITPSGTNSPIGTITVNGNLTLQNGSVLTIATTGTTNSSVNVSGATTLAGTLVIAPTTGTTLSYGQKIIFMSAASFSGSFSSVEVPTGFRGRV